MVKGACVAQGGGVRGERGGRAWYAPTRDTAGHCAGGTHPTGMHSCCIYTLF